MLPTSLGAMLRQTAERVPNRVAFLYPVKDRFDPVTFAELRETVRRYAGALAGLGIVRGDRVAILAENSVDWAYVDWACQALGAVLVPIYPTLPSDQAIYIVRDSGAKLVITGDENQAAKVEGTNRIDLKSQLAELAAASEGHFTTPELDAITDQVGPEDMAILIYTSGTTGTPKGVMLPHRALIHVAVSAKKHIQVGETDVFLSFLPMSHVYERVAGQVLPIYLGATIAFAKNLASISGDMLKVHPTVMLCVPRFLESMRDRILDAVAKQPPGKQRLFHLALDQGIRRAQGKLAPLAWLTDRVVMSKLRERTGGHMRHFVSGGAALAPPVAEFYMALGLSVLQGYGLTETAGGSAVNRPENNRYWTVGEPLDMEVVIAEDGEILMRGPGLMLGYYNLPGETEKAIDGRGFFHTGDIGEFEGKNLRITDRKKDILVLGNGKNVSPQMIENKLRTSPYIQEVVLFGDGLDACVALVVPNGDLVRQTIGLPDAETLANNDGAHALLKREIDKVNRTGANFEAVRKFALLDQPFTIESGELTPTLKIKRKVVAERYRDLIASLNP